MYNKNRKSKSPYKNRKKIIPITVPIIRITVRKEFLNHREKRRRNLMERHSSLYIYIYIFPGKIELKRKENEEIIDEELLTSPR